MKTDVLIIGAGIAGLSCAYYLKRDYLVIEKESVPGGACRTDSVNGFLFDRAEHFIRVPNAKVHDFFCTILGNNFYKQPLNASIYYKGRLIPYPFQKNIYSLDDKDKLLCFKEFLLRKKSPENKRSFGDWIISHYGKGIADCFMLPYNKKIWQHDPFKMRSDFSFAPGLIPAITDAQMLEYVFLPCAQRKDNSINYRYYLKKGGIGSFANKLAERISAIHFNRDVASIDAERKCVVCRDGARYYYNKLISTIPLTALVRSVSRVPQHLKRESKKLVYNSVCVFNFALKRKTGLRDHWIYYSQKEIPFARLYVSDNFNTTMSPGKKGTLSALYPFLPKSRQDFNSLEQFIKHYLVKAGVFSNKDIEFTYRQIIPYGTPIPTLGSDKIVDKISCYLKLEDIITIGRYGLWKYLGIEHAIQDGQNINNILHKLNIKKGE